MLNHLIFPTTQREGFLLLSLYGRRHRLSEVTGLLGEEPGVHVPVLSAVG